MNKSSIAGWFQHWWALKNSLSDRVIICTKSQKLGHFASAATAA
jgi:hypothetical protein